jgi:hypothetical protein
MKFLFVFFLCGIPSFNHGQQQPPFDVSRVAPYRKIGRAMATFSHGKRATQISVGTDALPLEGDTENGLFMTTGFIVFGRKVVKPRLIELEFVSYFAKRRFSSNRKIEIFADDKLIYSGNLKLLTSGTSAEGIVTEVLDTRLPYPQLLRLMSAMSTRVIIGDFQVRLNADNIDALRDLKKLIDSSVSF